MRAEEPGLIEVDGGLKLRGAPLWLDARRPVPLSFVSSALTLRRHQRVLLSAATAEMMKERLGSSEALASPMGRPFSLGDIGLELVPSGHVVGGAELLLRWKGATILYVGGFRPGPPAVAEGHERRAADVVVLDCPYDAPPFALPPRKKVAAELVAWVREVLGESRLPLLLASPLGTAQELCRLLTDEGLPVRAHRSVAAWNRRVRRAGRDPGPAHELRRAVGPGEAAVVAALGSDGPTLERLAPRARRALVSARALVPTEVEAAAAEAAFPLSSHGDGRALRALVRDAGARHVYLGPRHTGPFEASLRRMGLSVTRFAAARPLAQLDLF